MTEPAATGRAATGRDRGTLLRLEIERVATGGGCVARYEGRVVFVRYALPGEVVLARLDEQSASPDGSRRRYWRADAVEILRPSPDRVAPGCPVFGPGGCGGCDWQHASLPAQREGKAAVVREQLGRLAGVHLDGLVVEPAAGEGAQDDGLGWRTRVRFAVDEQGRAGFLAARSHRVVPVAACPLAHPDVAAADVPGRRWPGMSAVEVAIGDAGPALVLPEAGATARVPASRDPRGRDPRGRDPRGGNRRGRGSGTTRTWVEHRVSLPGAGERGFRVSRGGFWQVHPAAAQTLVDAVIAATRPGPGERALDLYSGVGLFATALGVAVGSRGGVVAVESDEGACADARRNLYDLPQVEIVRDRVEVALARLADREPTDGLDLVVLDPPRSGAGRSVMALLARLRPRRIAYVACDPATLARDVALAAADGYRLTALRAFDLFPMTHHVECLATLEPAR